MKRLCSLVLVLSVQVAPALAEPLAALTVTNQLVRFDSATPGTATSTAITGLQTGDQLVGIDLRPSNSVLYGLAVNSSSGGSSSIGRIYSINPSTGAATLASTLSADPADVTAPNPFAGVVGTFLGSTSTRPSICCEW